MPIFFNTEIHGWDGSQLYGGQWLERQEQVRSHEKGTLKVSQKGPLPSMGTDRSGNFLA